MGNKPRRGVGAAAAAATNLPNGESARKKQQQHYLSPAAASTLASIDGALSGGDSYDDASGAGEDRSSMTAPPTPVAVSPNSSAPSSPRGSVQGSVSAEDNGNNNNNASASTTTDTTMPPPSMQDLCHDTPGTKGSVVGGGGDDPYADVRERMEELSHRDKKRHVYHEKVAREGHPPPCSAGAPPPSTVHQDITIFAAITTYLGYVVLIVTGHVRDICANVFRKGRYFRSKNKMMVVGDDGEQWSPSAVNPPGNYPSDDFTKYAPLLKSWENFYTRRLYHRIQDCFNRPIASRPSAVISVLERVSFDGNKTMSVLGPLSNLEDDDGGGGGALSYRSGEHYRETTDGRVVRRCLNLGSYNYLGFADDWDVTCRGDVTRSLADLPSSVGSSRSEFGTTRLHRDVERIVASFAGKEDALVLNMGFNTNATIIPALTSRGDLIVSDELNHTSIVNGARASGAAIRTFRHNDAADLELILREAIVYGQPRTRRPWNRILVVVEGVYSMEGEYCDLRNVVTVCKKYGAYVYLDEAHSIGAMGPTGRGCCEYSGVDPGDVDVLMGTFTKSFGGMGGYVAADRRVIDELRAECAGSAYHNSLSPVVCQQIVSSFGVIMGRDGTDIGARKLDALRDNSNYFRMRLTDMGLHVLGNYDSPIMPVMLYNPTKIAAFSRECLKRGLAVVVVGFPAVPILMSRARFCISAGHTREELDRALKELDEIADLLKLRYARSTFG